VAQKAENAKNEVKDAASDIKDAAQRGKNKA